MSAGGRPALRMRWERLLFLHWAVEPGEIERVLPAGLDADLFDGRAWLGIVPFAMRRVRPQGLFEVPWLSNFLELNVRTYVVGPDGRAGVWFTSLSCDQPVAVTLARALFHLPYRHARMSLGVAYRCARRGGSDSEFAYEAIEAGGVPAGPGTLEEFLVERYLLFSADRAGRLYAGRVAHEPYRVTPARVAQWSFAPAADDGFRNPERPPDHALVAEPVDVKAWPIERIGGRVPTRHTARHPSR